MNSLNRVQLIGNLTADPEHKVTQNGTDVAKFSIATNMTIKLKDGTSEERVEYHRLTAFGRLADLASKWLKKGKKVYVEARLTTNKYTDKEGNTKYSIEIIVQDIIFLTPKETDQSAPQSNEESLVDAATDIFGGEVL